MSKCIAIIGLGQLGQLLAKRVQCDRLLLISGDQAKAAELASKLSTAEAATLEQIIDADIILMALPAHTMVEYTHANAASFRSDALLVNMATLLPTDTLRQANPSLLWTPLKVLGSVKALELGGSTQLITDSERTRDQLQPHLEPLGEVIAGSEDWVVQCNQIASMHALEAALNIADEIRRLGLPEAFIYNAQTLVARGVIQSFADNTLGHFGKEMLERVLEKRQD